MPFSTSGGVGITSTKRCLPLKLNSFQPAAVIDREQITAAHKGGLRFALRQVGRDRRYFIGERLEFGGADERVYLSQRVAVALGLFLFVVLVLYLIFGYDLRLDVGLFPVAVLRVSLVLLILFVGDVDEFRGYGRVAGIHSDTHFGTENITDDFFDFIGGSIRAERSGKPDNRRGSDLKVISENVRAEYGKRLDGQLAVYPMRPDPFLRQCHRKENLLHSISP